VPGGPCRSTSRFHPTTFESTLRSLNSKAVDAYRSSRSFSPGSYNRLSHRPERDRPGTDQSDECKQNVGQECIPPEQQATSSRCWTSLIEQSRACEQLHALAHHEISYKAAATPCMRQCRPLLRLPLQARRSVGTHVFQAAPSPIPAPTLILVLSVSRTVRCTLRRSNDKFDLVPARTSNVLLAPLCLHLLPLAKIWPPRAVVGTARKGIAECTLCR
jgi:hypothetical protein